MFCRVIDFPFSNALILCKSAITFHESAIILYMSTIRCSATGITKSVYYIFEYHIYVLHLFLNNKHFVCSCSFHVYFTNNFFTTCSFHVILYFVVIYIITSFIEVHRISIASLCMYSSPCIGILHNPMCAFKYIVHA